MQTNGETLPENSFQAPLRIPFKLLASLSYVADKKILPIFRFKEAKANIVNIDGVAYSGLKFVIDSIYKPDIEITMENVSDVLSAANLLQVTHVFEECKKWMTKKVTKENCFTFLQLAVKFSIKCLKKEISWFIRRNFTEVRKTDAFVEISKETLIEFLSANSLVTHGQESAVYQAARKWILANDVSSEGIVEIMSHVKFGLIPVQMLHQEIASENFIDDNKECRKMISEATLYHTNIYTQPFYDGPLNKPRGYWGLMVIQSSPRSVGYNTTSTSVQIRFTFLPSLLQIRPDSSLDIQIVHSSLNSIQINTFLYIFGTSCQGYQNFTKRYDSTTDTWLELAPVPTHATVGSAVVRVEKQIFFMGGMTVGKNSRFSINPKQVTDGVFVYNITENKWSLGKELPQKLLYSAVTSKGRDFFLSGGFSCGNKTIKKTWVYDIAADVWRPLANMNHRRCKHVLETVTDKMYTLGGEIVATGALVPSIEAYDLTANQWTVVLSNGFENTLFSSFVSKSEIYLVGGTEFEDKVHVYDSEQNKVGQAERCLPFPCESNACAHVKLQCF